MTKEARRQSGFGLLETMAGLVVFVLLAIVGTRAYRGVVENQKEARQVKALTDAVTVTAERLSALSVATLTEPGCQWLSWSAPAPIGDGEYLFRYHTVPRPSVNGAQDTSTVGLEVEIGAATKAGGFTAARLFATLIAPHISSKDKLGETSTAKERAAEASFYADLQARIQHVAADGKDLNQVRLNSFSCYDKSQCCPYMEKYFKNLKDDPADGLDQKCHYRCALAGNVSIKEWNAACGKDFCAIAPWRTKDQCCAAIAKGECKAGTVCANVCIDCLNEDGSTCTSSLKCDDGWWNDFFDCAKGTMCNGQPIPDYVPEWGNVNALCKTPKCAAIPASCQDMTFSCCNGYYQRTAAGLDQWLGAAVCKDLVRQSDCCNVQINAGYWNFTCSGDGKIITSTYYNKNITLCGAPPGSDWDKYCAVNKGCPSTFTTPGSTGGCGSWTGYPTDDPWHDPDPTSTGVHYFGPSANSGDVVTGGPTTSKDGGTRGAKDRDGWVKDSKGGRE